MCASHNDVKAAILLVRVVTMSEDEMEKLGAVAIVSQVCGWVKPRALRAVQEADAQWGLPPEGNEPTDADLAEMLLSVVAREPPGLNFERLLAMLRRWPRERARSALAEAARAGLLRRVSALD